MRKHKNVQRAWRVDDATLLAFSLPDIELGRKKRWSTQRDAKSGRIGTSRVESHWPLKLAEPASKFRSYLPAQNG